MESKNLDVRCKHCDKLLFKTVATLIKYGILRTSCPEEFKKGKCLMRKIDKAQVQDKHIKEKTYGDLVVLDYDQIKSPKNDPLVRQCRGLIVDSKYYIVSRGFDRFFNYGEVEVDLPKKLRVVEKVDGSLIKVYYWNSSWHISTRGTAFADSQVGDFEGMTFSRLVLEALPAPDANVFDLLDRDYTHIFEITSRFNRVVTRHTDEPTLWYLGSRNNKDGSYKDFRDTMKQDIRFIFIKYPQEFFFNSVDEAVSAADNLANLKEGFVIYCADTLVPVLKIKSPAYVKAHRLRGNNGMTLKNMASLVATNEQEEYLTYFPEDKYLVDKLVNRINHELNLVQNLYNYCITLKTRKEMALAIVGLFEWNFLVFKAIDRKNGNIKEVFEEYPPNKKVKFIMALCKDAWSKNNV